MATEREMLAMQALRGDDDRPTRVRKLAANVIYSGVMDPEVLGLCNALNALPGISTTESCCGHGREKFSIFFQTYGRCHKEGLFFLARCIDRRYWKHGHHWEATLVVGDTYPQQEPRLGLPVSYILACEVKGEEAYKQAEDLVRNLNHHLNHANFIKAFELDLSKFLTTITDHWPRA